MRGRCARPAWLGVVGVLAASLFAACGGGSGGTSSGATSATEAGATSGGAASTSAVAATDQPAGGAAVDAITWAISDDIVKIDPAFSYDYNTSTVMPNVTEGLLRFDQDGHLQPNLAASWKEVDPTTYVYDLRTDVTFHDGAPLTAEDVKFSFDRIRDPKVGSFLAQFHERVQSVDVTGPSQITVRLSKPDATWKYTPATLAGAVVEKKFVEAHPEDVGQAGVGIVGTGPYRFVSWEPGQSIVLEAYDGYWDTAHAPKVKKVTIRVIKDEATIVAGLGSGEIDGTFAIGGRSAKTVSGPVRLVTNRSYNAAFIVFNTQKAPFSDARVRQAFSYALDKKGILDSVYGGLGTDSRSPAPPALWTYGADAFKAAYEALDPYALDLDKAKQLVQDAGAAGTKAQLMVSTPLDQQVGLAVQDAGKAIGIDVELKQIAYADKTGIEYADGPKDYEMDLLTWGSDFPDPIGNLYFPFNSANVVTNVAAYKNADVDRYLEEARSATDDGARAKALTEAQAIVVRDQPWVVYAAPDMVMPLNTRLTGYVPTGLYYWTAWAAQLSGTGG